MSKLFAELKMDSGAEEGEVVDLVEHHESPPTVLVLAPPADEANVVMTEPPSVVSVAPIAQPAYWDSAPDAMRSVPAATSKKARKRGRAQKQQAAPSAAATLSDSASHEERYALNLSAFFSPARYAWASTVPIDVWSELGRLCGYNRQVSWSPLESPLATFVADLKAGCHADLARSKLFDATRVLLQQPDRPALLPAAPPLAVVSAPSSSVSLEQKAPDIAATVASAKAALSDDDMDCTDDQPTLLPLRAPSETVPPSMPGVVVASAAHTAAGASWFYGPAGYAGAPGMAQNATPPASLTSTQVAGFPAAHQHAPSGPGGQPALLHRSSMPPGGGHVAGRASPVAPATGAIQRMPPPAQPYRAMSAPSSMYIAQYPTQGLPSNQHRGAAMAHVPPPGAGPSAHLRHHHPGPQGIPEPLEQRRDSSRWNAAPAPPPYASDATPSALPSRWGHPQQSHRPTSSSPFLERGAASRDASVNEPHRSSSPFRDETSAPGDAASNRNHLVTDIAAVSSSSAVPRRWQVLPRVEGSSADNGYGSTPKPGVAAPLPAPSKESALTVPGNSERSGGDSPSATSLTLSRSALAASSAPMSSTSPSSARPSAATTSRDLPENLEGFSVLVMSAALEAALPCPPAAALASTPVTFRRDFAIAVDNMRRARGAVVDADKGLQDATSSIAAVAAERKAHLQVRRAKNDAGLARLHQLPDVFVCSAACGELTKWH